MFTALPANLHAEKFQKLQNESWLGIKKKNRNPNIANFYRIERAKKSNIPSKKQINFKQTPERDRGHETNKRIFSTFQQHAYENIKLQVIKTWKYSTACKIINKK